jgi:hypothetical protein
MNHEKTDGPKSIPGLRHAGGACRAATSSVRVGAGATKDKTRLVREGFRRLTLRSATPVVAARPPLPVFQGTLGRPVVGGACRAATSSVRVGAGATKDKTRPHRERFRRLTLRSATGWSQRDHHYQYFRARSGAQRQPAW